MSNWNTARQLGSPNSSLSPFSPTDLPPARPSMNRLHSRPTGRRRRRSSILGPSPSFKDKAIYNLLHVQEKAIETWDAATPRQRLLFVVGLLVMSIIGITFLILSPRILDAIGPIAESWRNLPGGWLILFFAITLTAFPPVIGYSTCLTIGGIVWGMKGWFICAAANVFGSLLSFIASRTVLAKYVHNLVGQDKRFTAFALTLKHDGIKILVMIRLCPLPYSLSNAALSTFPTVNTLNFVLATAAATPKLLIHVFVGSRLAAIAESGGKMDLGTKLINYFSIIAFGILGAVMGYVIYEKTVERARQIEEAEAAALADDTPLAGAEGGYFEDAEPIAEDGWEEDDVSLWDNDEPAVGGGGYRDDWSDDNQGGAAKPKNTTLLDEEAALQNSSGAWGGAPDER